MMPSSRETDTTKFTGHRSRAIKSTFIEGGGAKMRLKSVLLVVSLLVLLPAAGARAQPSLVGPEAVWDLPANLFGSFTDCYERLECLMSVMKRGGASPQAMAFTRMMKDNCYLEKFTKMGKVDLAYVFFPGRANTNWAYFLVNGSPPIIATEDVHLAGQEREKFSIDISIDITKDPLYASWSKRYSKLNLYQPAVFQQMQSLPDGGQRFIFAYALIDGARVGKQAGWVLVAFNFDAQGRFLQARLVRLTQEIRE
jgi:hypothetical protein